jgi:very-short-patch-repair endonuclease
MPVEYVIPEKAKQVRGCRVGKSERRAATQKWVLPKAGAGSAGRSRFFVAARALWNSMRQRIAWPRVLRARELRKKQTPAEELLWELLRDRQCRELKLAVELDGEPHNAAARQKKDAARDAYLKSQGVTWLRFENRIAIETPEVILESIARHAANFSPTGRGGGEGAPSDFSGDPARDLSIHGIEKTDETGRLCRLNLAGGATATRSREYDREELVIFDILTRSRPELSAEERTEVKKVARELLNRLKQLLVLNWRQKSAARSQLKLAIEDVLDTLPTAYDRPLYAQKCSALLEHIYERYPEPEAGTYGLAS